MPPETSRISPDRGSFGSTDGGGGDCRSSRGFGASTSVFASCRRRAIRWRSSWRSSTSSCFGRFSRSARRHGRLEGRPAAFRRGAEVQDALPAGAARPELRGDRASGARPAVLDAVLRPVHRRPGTRCEYLVGFSRGADPGRCAGQALCPSRPGDQGCRLLADVGADRRCEPGGSTPPAQQRGGEGGDQGRQDGRRDLARQAGQGGAEGHRRTLDAQDQQGQGRGRRHRRSATSRSRHSATSPTSASTSGMASSAGRRSPTPPRRTAPGCARG